MFFSLVAMAKVDIELSSDVQLSDRVQITLADVLPIVNLDKNYIDQAKKVVLMEVNFQEKIALSKEDIIRVVRENSEIQKIAKTQKYSLIFPEKINVEILQGKYSRIEFEKLINQELKNQCVDCRFQLSISQMPKFLNKDWSVDFSNLKLKNSFLLPIKVAINQRDESYYLSGQLKIFQKGLVVKRMILQGQKLNLDDVAEKELEITSLSDALVSTNDLKGKITTRTINVQTPITFSVLKNEFVVKRGQMIRALIGTDQFEVSTQMQSDSDGYIGDKVRLKSIENQKQFLGTVLSAEAVKIE